MRRGARPWRPDQASGGRGLAAGLPDTYGSGRRGGCGKYCPVNRFMSVRPMPFFGMRAERAVMQAQRPYHFLCKVPKAKALARAAAWQGPGFFICRTGSPLPLLHGSAASARLLLQKCGAELQPIPRRTVSHLSCSCRAGGMHAACPRYASVMHFLCIRHALRVRGKSL